MTKHRIFVYGTLKRAYHNNRLLTGSRFLGEAISVDNFDMIDVGFPVLLPQRGDVAYPVKGEVYEVDALTLKVLDRLESEGRMYQRQTRAILPISNEPCCDTMLVDVYVGIAKDDDGRWEWGKEVKPVPVDCGALVRGDGFVAYDWEPQNYDDNNEETDSALVRGDGFVAYDWEETEEEEHEDDEEA